jgi:Fur family zinc uptake transcriptional regulator
VVGRKAKSISSQLDAAAKACVARNTQLTDLRRTVLGLILEAEKPLTAYQLLDKLRPTRKSAAPPTIYRALEFLIENKLIHKVERLNAFIPCSETDHPHTHAVQFLICRGCSKVQEMEDRAASRALEAAARRQGFHPTVAIVELEGTCAECHAPA